jgi:hypothetical protein
MEIPLKKSKSISLEQQPIDDRRADDFESVAHRLGCDEDKSAFEATLGKIAARQPAKENS